MRPNDPRNLFHQHGVDNTDAVYQEYIWMVRGALVSTFELAGPSFRGAVLRAFRRQEQEQSHEHH